MFPEVGAPRGVAAKPAQVTFTERYTGGAYLEHAPDWHAADSAWKAGKVFEMIERNRLQPTSVCDVGCGAGEILVQLRPRLGQQVRLVGYDISAHAIQLAKTKEASNLCFRQGDFSRDSDFARNAAESHDLVLLLDVFEHVPDYLSFLTQLRARGRRFIFHIPLDLHAQSVLRGSRHMLEMRREFGHLHYFTIETALATLSDTGYSVLDQFYTWDHEDQEVSLRQSWKRPWRWGVQRLDRALFALEPELAARLRPHFNVMVLAEPAA
ncbi:MAG: hypothetical protein RL685_1776 [Pseudomonadota bacterium]